jgi:hypothetical protein
MPQATKEALGFGLERRPSTDRRNVPPSIRPRCCARLMVVVLWRSARLGVGESVALILSSRASIPDRAVFAKDLPMAAEHPNWSLSDDASGWRHRSSQSVPALSSSRRHPPASVRRPAAGVGAERENRAALLAPLGAHLANSTISSQLRTRDNQLHGAGTPQRQEQPPRYSPTPMVYTQIRAGCHYFPVKQRKIPCFRAREIVREVAANRVVLEERLVRDHWGITKFPVFSLINRVSSCENSEQTDFGRGDQCHRRCSFERMRKCAFR